MTDEFPEHRLVHEEDLLRSDLDALNAANYVDALAAARLVSFDGTYFCDHDPASMPSSADSQCVPSSH